MKSNHKSIQNTESPTLCQPSTAVSKKRSPKSGFPYRVDAEAVSVGDAEGVVLVCKDDDVRHRVDPHGVVVGPEHGAHVQGQGRQVTLGEDRLHKLKRQEEPLTARVTTHTGGEGRIDPCSNPNSHSGPAPTCLLMTFMQNTVLNDYTNE